MLWSQWLPGFIFSGRKYHCNLCGKNSGWFLPRGHNYPILEQAQVVGAGYRMVDCPHCGSTDRDRLIFDFLKLQSSKHSFQGKTLLHVAPEKPLIKVLRDHFRFEVTAMDARAKGYKWSYNNRVIEADLTNLPFADNSFDWVIANHVMEHIPDEKRALSEISRVLKNKGCVILQVPYSLSLTNTIEASKEWTSKERIHQLGQFDHVRLYGKDVLLRFSLFGMNFSWENIELTENERKRLKISLVERVIFGKISK